MSIYQHFPQSEHAFLDKILEWQADVEQNYAPKLTNFLDPREQDVIQSVVGKNADIKIKLSGGQDRYERKRALLHPDYYEPMDEDFQLAFFELRYPEKFVTIEHRDLLGALMSIGLKREKFGDIIFSEERVQFVLAEEVSDYVELQLESVGKAKVHVFPIEKEQLIEVKDEWAELNKTVSSLRLDAVLSEAYSLSRAKVIALIEKGYVHVNWKTIEQPSYQVHEGDFLSIRGFGRSKLLEIVGKSKKDRWRLRLGRKK